MDSDGDAKMSGVEPEKQPVVLLDVGGQSFKIAKSTLERYPECLLAKMVDEFPSIVNQGKAIYIDRNPLAFSWILEIHRGGIYKSCVPSLPKECLQMELDFYQLPSLEELGVDVLDSSFAHRETVAKNLLSNILHEIEACGLKEIYQWDIFVYHRIVDKRLDGGMKIVVLGPSGLGFLEHVNDRGHEDFYNALLASPTNCLRDLNPELLTIRPKNTNVYYTLMLATARLVSLLNVEAEKFGLVVSPKTFSSKTRAGISESYNVFRLQYKNE